MRNGTGANLTPVSRSEVAHWSVRLTRFDSNMLAQTKKMAATSLTAERPGKVEVGIQNGTGGRT